MSKNRISSYILLLSVSLMWGLATPVIKFTLQAIEPFPFLLYRFFISSIVGVFILYYHRDQLSLVKKNFPIILGYSLFAVTFALGLLFLGLQRTTVLDTILIAAISPLVIAYFGVHFFREKITKQEKLGLAIAITGTLITIIDPILRGANKELFQFTGNILVMGYLLTDAFSNVFAKKMDLKGLNPFVLISLAFIIGFITFIPLSLVTQPINLTLNQIFSLELKYHFGVLYMALISGTLAYSIYVKAIKDIEISEAGLFAYLNPVFAAPLAVLWLNESMTYPFIVGAVIIIIGVTIAESRRQKLN